MDQTTQGTAIVTGGAQGIGKAIAQRLLQEGYSVVLAEVDAEAGEETREELAAAGEVHFMACDVSREEDVRGLMDATVELTGRLDVLVNNAAISRRKPIDELSLAEWQQVIGVNLTGAFLCAKYAAPALRRHNGRIINIASTRALMSEPNTEAYSATKGGIVALTHALAMSLGPAVRVNCISPGWIDVSGWKKRSQRRQESLGREDHEQHPTGRVGRPEDIAALVAWLAGEEAGFISGQNFVVDGGMTRKMIYAE